MEIKDLLFCLMCKHGIISINLIKSDRLFLHIIIMWFSHTIQSYNQCWTL